VQESAETSSCKSLYLGDTALDVLSKDEKTRIPEDLKFIVLVKIEKDKTLPAQT